MSFPMNLTSVLTGLTMSQLRGLRTKRIVVPEVRAERPPLYSFRDLVALRAIAYLRSQTSLQRVSRAFQSMDLYDLSDHPSQYRFGTDGVTIFCEQEDGSALDLVKSPGQIELFSFEEITNEFTNFRGELVTDFNNPHEDVEVNFRRMGGWPTVRETRVPFDTIANLVDFKTVMPADVHHFYPSVSAKAAENAKDFASRIAEAG